MDTVLTLADIHPRDRLAFWYDVACEVFVDHECRVQTPSRFDVTMHHAPLGDLGIVKLDSTGLNFAAVTSRTITNAEDDVFFLCLQVSGSATFHRCPSAPRPCSAPGVGLNPNAPLRRAKSNKPMRTQLGVERESSPPRHIVITL